MRRAQYVFLVAKMSLCHDANKEPLDIIIGNNGAVNQEVRCIIFRQRFKRSGYFIVGFVGESRDEATWLSRIDRCNCADALREFSATHASTRTSSAKNRANVTR